MGKVSVLNLILLGALSHEEQIQLLFLIRKAQCAD